MDNDIVYLLKFGERKYMERLAEGFLYFTNALTLRGIEKEQKIKGQGDMLEGGSIIAAQNVKMVSNETGETVVNGIEANLVVHYEPSNGTPVFCLFACYNNDCKMSTSEGNVIALSNLIKEDIRTHFPKADTVAIIKNPKQFIFDVCQSIESTCIHEPVHYFHIQGIKEGKNIYNDYQYLYYLTQDSVEGSKVRSFKAEYSYRSLLCKDVFFEKEQEYRFVLPNLEIEKPREFFVKLTNTIELQELNEFFKEH